MKALWLLALVCACGPDAPTDLGSCGDWPDLATASSWRCEAACRNQPTGYGGTGPGQPMPCTGHHVNPATMTNDDYRCGYPFTDDGHLGCCEAVDTDGDPNADGPIQIWFFECE